MGKYDVHFGGNLEEEMVNNIPRAHRKKSHSFLNWYQKSEEKFLQEQEQKVLKWRGATKCSCWGLFDLRQ